MPGIPMDRPRKKILVIEDDPDISLLLVALLGRLDVEVLTAPDGRVGVAIATSEKPHLILMDINMPRMNGLEAIRTIRGYAELSNVPIIVLTAFANPENIREAVDVGADDFLVKANLLAGEGIDRIRQALETRPTRRRSLLRSESPFGHRSP